MGEETEMGREMGGDGKLRSSVAGRDADGRSDGTRTGLMNGVPGFFPPFSLNMHCMNERIVLES